MHIREDILFIILSSITVIAAIMTIGGPQSYPWYATGGRPLHPSIYSVFWLILAFIGSSGLFIIIGLEFMGLMLIIIYVGAICIIFLFVIMMIPGEATLRKSDDPKQLVRQGHPISYTVFVGTLIGAVLITELSLVGGPKPVPTGGPQGVVPSGHAPSDHNSPMFYPFLTDSFMLEEEKEISPFLTGSPTGRFESPVETQTLPVGHAMESLETLNGAGHTNLEAIGSVLYVDYYFLFILVSLILLVAMIGTIVLGRTKEK